MKAKKDIASSDSAEHNKIKEEKDCNDLIKNWAEKSQTILLMIHKKEKILTKNRNSQSFIPFRSMGAHINMP